VQLEHLFMFIVQKIRFFKIILLFVLIFLLNQEHLHPSSDLVFRDGKYYFLNGEKVS
jgi:hypothetical protein